MLRNTRASVSDLKSKRHELTQDDNDPELKIKYLRDKDYGGELNPFFNHFI